MSGLDITKNFRSVEKLKTNLLSEVAALFENLQNHAVDEEDIAKNLANITFNTYILSYKLGLDIEDLEYNLMQKLKLETLNDNSLLSKEARAIISHLQQR